MMNNHSAERFPHRHTHRPPPVVQLPSEKECAPPCDMDVQEGQERMQGEVKGKQEPKPPRKPS